MAMPQFPGGTVTLFFTDIERSTTLLEELGERYVDRRRDRQSQARPGES
jgi:hypothetical protein